ncbi:MAG: hypothetical protein ACLGHL_01835 [Actinomycetota bacterium]
MSLVEKPTQAVAISMFFDLLRKQAGVATVHQAYHLGVSRSRLRTLLRTGVLNQIAYGIVEAAGSPDTYEKKMWLGLMYGATRTLENERISAICGPTAAWMFDLIDERPAEIHIISTRRVDPPREGFIFHRTSRLPEAEIVDHKGFPVTDPVRTYLDMAALHPYRAVSLLRRGMRKKVLQHEAVLDRIEVEARQGRSGIAVARDAAMRTHPDAARAKSWLEDHFFDLLVSFGYPPPERNVKVPSSYGHDWEIDLFDRGRRKGIEISHSDIHSDPWVQRKDRRKENDLRIQGIEIATVTEETTDEEFYAIAVSLFGPPPGISGE